MRHLSLMLIVTGLMVPAGAFALSPDTLHTPERIALFHEAEAMAFAPSGDVYVSTDRGASLLRIDPSTGIATEHIGIPGEMDAVTALAVSQNLSIYLADRTRVRIRRYSRGFRRTNEYHTEDSDNPFTDLDAFVVDNQQRIFAISRRDSRMAIWSDDELPTILGDMREGAGQLIEPVDIALKGSSSILVADAGNGSILEFDRWGSFNRIMVSNLSESLSHISVYGDQVWLLDGAVLLSVNEHGEHIQSYELQIPGRYMDLAATSSGIFILTPSGLYRLPVSTSSRP